MTSNGIFPGRAAGLAVLLAMTAAAPAHAQLGDVLKRAGDALDRMPPLSSFLEGEPPIKTSLDDLGSDRRAA